MTLAELRALLDPHGIRPIKGRSQHFLLEDAVVAAMCDAAGVGARSNVLEIGPGPGILTAELLRRGAHVVAVELDPRLCVLLRERFGDAPNFTLIEGDALTQPNAALAVRFPDPRGYDVVANLPYAVTSAVLQKFLLEAPVAASLTVMIQKEVADRLVARAEKGEMGSLSVLAQAHAEISRVKEVPKGAFYPPPQVESTVVRLVRRSEAELAELFGTSGPDFFFKVTQAAFAAPRKQLRNTLQAVLADETKLAAALAKANVDPANRPERLSVADWGRLVPEIAVSLAKPRSKRLE